MSLEKCFSVKALQLIMSKRKLKVLQDVLKISQQPRVSRNEASQLSDIQTNGWNSGFPDLASGQPNYQVVQ